jgi:hypothetical protein
MVAFCFYWKGPPTLNNARVYLYFNNRLTTDSLIGYASQDLHRCMCEQKHALGPRKVSFHLSGIFFVSGILVPFASFLSRMALCLSEMHSDLFLLGLFDRV